MANDVVGELEFFDVDADAETETMANTQASPTAQASPVASSGLSEAAMAHLISQANGDPAAVMAEIAQLPPSMRPAAMAMAHRLLGNAAVNATGEEGAFVDVLTAGAIHYYRKTQTAKLDPAQEAYRDKILSEYRGRIDAKGAHEIAKSSRELTSEDRRIANAAVRQAASAKVTRVDDPNNPNLVQLMIAFDGTGNDAGVDPVLTNPARLAQSFAGEGGNIYARGVGTEAATKSQELWEGATGANLMVRVREVYNDLANKINDIKRRNPNAEVVITITGFSRGSATSIVFANFLNDHGIPVRDGIGRDQFGLDGKPLKHDAPRIGAMVLFDTVYALRDEDKIPYARGIPKNVENVLHLMADSRADAKGPEGETREAFAVRHAAPKGVVDPRITEIEMTGAHSDVGGSYPNGMSGVALGAARSWLSNVGVPLEADPGARTNADGEDLRLHDSRWFSAEALTARGHEYPKN